MSSNGRRVSRRDFLRATGLAVGATALAACAPAAPASVGPAEAGAPAAAGATTEIVVAQYADVVNLDPQDTNDNASYGPEKLMYEGLVGYNAAMEMEAQLAERWEASDDATEFTFFLRQGINFHDGTPFNAEAVKYNFERVINPDNALKRYGLYNIIASVEVIDEYTVKFTTTKPFGAMLATFAHPAGGIISPTAAAQYSDVHEFGKNPVGTGPFKFVEWVPGDHLTVEKFDGYWNSDAAARLIASPSSRCRRRARVSPCYWPAMPTSSTRCRLRKLNWWLAGRTLPLPRTKASIPIGWL